MNTEISCPNGHSIPVKQEQAGSRVPCPQCQEVVSVPADLDTSKELAANVATGPYHPAEDLERMGRVHPESTAAVERPSRRWLWGTAIAVAILAGTGLAVILAWQKDQLPSGGRASKPAVEVPTDERPPYPRIPGAVSRLPGWLIEEAPFDLEGPFTPIPRAENAAPLYLEALVEFDPAVASCFPKDQQVELMQRARERDRLYDDLLKRWGNDFDRFHAERTDADNYKLDRLLAEHERALETLARAQERKKCVFETGIDITSLLPHAQTAPQVARILQLKLARELDRGDFDQALDSIERTLRLNRDLRPRGPVITQLIAMSMEGIVEDSMVPLVLKAPGCTTAHCDRLLTILVDHERRAINSFSMAVRMEYVMVRTLVHNIRYRTGPFAPDRLTEVARSFGLEEETIGAVLLQMALFVGSGRASKFEVRQVDTQVELMLDDDYVREGEAVNHYYARLRDASRLDYQGKQQRLAELEPQIEQPFFLSILAPSSTNFIEAVERAKTRSHATQCLVALRRWQFESPGVPPDLQAVIEAAGLESIPTDTYSGEPLKMTILDGTPVIYSVGKDGKDDRGRIDWNNGQGPGDFLFRLKQ